MTERKKVVIIADALDFQYAGIKVYLEGLVNQLQQSDAYNEYILLRADEDFRDYAGQVYVKSYVSQFLHPKSRLLVEIPKAIKQINPDVVVEPCHFGPFRLKSNMKRVTFIHDLTPVSHPQFHSSNSVLLHKLLLPGILKRASLVVTNSKRTEADLISNFVYAKGKTAVIYPGSQNLRQYQDNGIAQIDIKNSNYILHVGTLEPRKNLIFLLDAFQEIKIRRPDIQLIISGKKGWKFKDLMSKLENHPNKEDIFITGYLEKEQIVTLYRYAECMFFCSHYEGFGIPLLEAMESGCPVITADNSSQKEVCKDAAVYIPTFDIEDWANAFLAVSEDVNLREQLISRGKQRAQEFSWVHSAAHFDHLITTLYEHEIKSK